MKTSYFIILSFIFSLINSENNFIPQEDDVLLINKQNFQQAIKQYDIILINFYAS